MKNLATSAQASQDFVPIEQVRDGVLVLKDGSVRAILMASSINIMLKSAEEQAAILRQFQNFLNSLDFSLQISIQSRELDIRPYIKLLEGRLGEQQTELMKIQVREYMDFVRNLVADSSIMTKSFYVIVPYNPPAVSTGGGVKGLAGMFAQNSGAEHPLTPQEVEEYRSQLEQRISLVVQGLGRLGVRTAQLGTEEVIELFYRLFNIGELERPLPVQDLSMLGQ
jgi:type IV secretory pathway VirB4 component